MGSSIKMQQYWEDDDGPSGLTTEFGDPKTTACEFNTPQPPAIVQPECLNDDGLPGMKSGLDCKMQHDGWLWPQSIAGRMTWLEPDGDCLEQCKEWYREDYNDPSSDQACCRDMSGFCMLANMSSIKMQQYWEDDDGPSGLTTEFGDPKTTACEFNTPQPPAIVQPECLNDDGLPGMKSGLDCKMQHDGWLWPQSIAGRMTWLEPDGDC